MVFPTIASMVNWISSNISEDGGNAESTVIARPYETIDESIPTVTKVYGLNRFYSALRGKRRYTSVTSTAFNSYSMQSQCASLYNRVWNTSFDNSSINLSAIWLSAATKNLYGNPRFRIANAYRVNLSEIVSRITWDTNNTIWKSNAQDTFINNNPGNFSWATMRINSSNIDTYSYGESSDVFKELKSGCSGVMMIGVSDQSTSVERAIVVKPIGIDQIVVNMPDFNLYDFEMLFFNNSRQGYVAMQSFSSTADFNHTSFDINGGKMRINAPEWLTATDNYHSNNINSTGYWNQFNCDTVRFRLRNKTTYEVSNLSLAGISTLNDNKISLRRMIVKNFEDI